MPNLQDQRPPVNGSAPISHRVMAVDDHQLMLVGIRMLISKSERLTLSSEARSAEEALDQLAAIDPDIVCIDLGLPGAMNGLDLCLEIRRRDPKARVVLYTASDDLDLPRRARKAGALAVVNKSDDFKELRRALFLAVAGKAYVSPVYEICGTELLADQQQKPPRSGTRLSPRQNAVCALLVLGMTNPEIAGELGIGIESVKTHIAAIFVRLKVHDRTEAAAEAIRRHLVN